MAAGLRLRIKRGDTSPAFRAQCLNGATPADLTGAQAALKLRREDGSGSRSLPLTVEAGMDGWVSHTWVAGETDIVGTELGEAEVIYASEARQTFPGDGYLTLEILSDLG